MREELEDSVAGEVMDALAIDVWTPKAIEKIHLKGSSGLGQLLDGDNKIALDV
jgi:hypothetical protein